MAYNLPESSDKTWIQVAETWGEMESAVIVGLLHAANIPTYVESIFPMSAFGQLGGPGKIYVPAGMYDMALTLLDSQDDDFLLDVPGIQI
jgi:hypothetical protein